MLHNVPRILDVETMLALLEQLGADVDWLGANEVRIQAADLTTHEVHGELASRIRASFLLAGPLLARFGRANVPPPGGDVIGRRRLDPHIHAFAELGAEIELERRLRAAAARCAARASTSTRRPSWRPRTRSWPRRSRPAGRRSRTRPASRTSRTSAASSSRSAPRSRASARTCSTSPASSGCAAASTRSAADHIEVGSFIGMAAVTGGDLTIDGDARRPRPDPAGVRAARAPGRDRRTTRSTCRRARSSRSATTSAARSRRSRTARGPRSRPT